MSWGHVLIMIFVHFKFRTPNAPKGPRRAFATPSPRTRRRMAANLTPEPVVKVNILTRNTSKITLIWSDHSLVSASKVQWLVICLQELPSKTPIMAFNDPTPVSSPRHQLKINKPVAKGREPKCKENKENSSDELVKQVKKKCYPMRILWMKKLLSSCYYSWTWKFLVSFICYASYWERKSKSWKKRKPLDQNLVKHPDHILLGLNPGRSLELTVQDQNPGHGCMGRKACWSILFFFCHL